MASASGSGAALPVTPSSSGRSAMSPRRSSKTSPYIKASLHISKKRIEQLEANVAALTRGLHASEAARIESEARKNEKQVGDTHYAKLKTTIDRRDAELAKALGALETRDVEHEQQQAELKATMEQREAEHKAALQLLCNTLTSELERRGAGHTTALDALCADLTSFKAASDKRDAEHTTESEKRDRKLALLSDTFDELARTEQRQAEHDAERHRKLEDLAAAMENFATKEAAAVVSRDEQIKRQVDETQQLSSQCKALRSDLDGIASALEEVKLASSPAAPALAQAPAVVEEAPAATEAPAAVEELATTLHDIKERLRRGEAAVKAGQLQARDQQACMHAYSACFSSIDKRLGELEAHICRIDGAVDRAVAASERSEAAIAACTKTTESYEFMRSWMYGKSGHIQNRLGALEANVEKVVATTADVKKDLEAAVARTKKLRTDVKQQEQELRSALETQRTTLVEQQTTLVAHKSELPAMRDLHDEHRCALARLAASSEGHHSALETLTSAAKLFDARFDALEAKRAQSEVELSAALSRLAASSETHAAQKQELDLALGKMREVEQKAQRVEEDLAIACDRLIKAMPKREPEEVDELEDDEMRSEMGGEMPRTT